MKVLKYDCKSTMETAYKEMQIMSSVRHRNIVRYEDYFT